MEMPEKIYAYISEDDIVGTASIQKGVPHQFVVNEYVRKDLFIENVINFLNYKLDDVVAIWVSGTIIPHHVGKQELIEDFVKFMKGE